MKKILNIILLIILTISNNTIIFANAANATTTENPPISVSAIEDTPVTSTADIENPNSTEKGQGTVSEYATDNSKEFYTITANTGDGEKETFYMVIDKNSSSENVYFLKEVEVDDITSLSKGSNNENETNEEDLNFVFGNEEVLENKETEKSEVQSEVQIDEVKNAAPEETDENNSSETKKTKSTSPIIIIVVCIVVGAFGYYKKIYKKKNSKADENNDIADTYDYISDNTDDTNNINDTIDEKEESTEELFKKYENIKNDDIDVSESDIYEENNNGDNEDNNDEQPQDHYVDEEEFI